MKTLIKNFSQLKRYHYIIIIGVINLLLHIIVAFIFYKPILRALVGSQKSLKPGNEVRDFYLKLPIAFDFRIYFFNVSNPQAVLEGAKPIVQEIGPYCYDAYKEKVEIVDNKKEDTLTYSPYNTYFYNQTKTESFKLSHDDYVTILNPLVVGIINTIAFYKPQFLNAANKILPLVFKENANIYLTVKVRDILFDGITIDCNIKDFTSGAACDGITRLPSFMKVGKNIFKFSIFGTRNGTDPKRITVKRGIKNSNDVGKLVKINEKTDFNVWSSESCDAYRGTDGWIFPSFLDKEDGIWSVAPDLCRSFQAHFEKDMTFKGVKVRKYFANFGDMSSNPEEKCFCSTNTSCLPKGVMNLTKCLNVPLFSTLPHFLDADKALFTQIDGLHPEKDKHHILIYFEPITGSPIYAQRRIQINYNMVPLDKISQLKNIRPVIHPVLWLEEGVELEGFLLKKVKSSLRLIKIGTILRYVGLFSWLGVIVFGCYKAWIDTKVRQIAPIAVSPSKTHQDEDSQDEKNNMQLNEAELPESETVNESRLVY